MRPSSFQILPPVIKNILIINVLFLFADFVLEKSFGIKIGDVFGLHFFFSPKFRIYQIITYLFIHADFFHLLSNMFSLWMFGAVLENYWGPKRFLTFYFVTGIGAAITHYAVYFYQVYPLIHDVNYLMANADTLNSRDLVELFRSGHLMITPELKEDFNGFFSQFQSLEQQGQHHQMASLITDFFSHYKEEVYNLPVVVGASGAIFGLLLAFGMLFPNTLIYIYFAIPIKAKYFVLFYGLVELGSGVWNNPGDNVAHFAHLGGMLFGFFLIKAWNKTNRQNFY